MPIEQNHIVAIHQMLFEMARGNFNSRIPLKGYGDGLETIAVLINMVAEEMRDSIFDGGYVNPHNSQQFISQTTFVLNNTFSIQSFTPEIMSFLGYSKSELVNKSLESLLTADSYAKLNDFLSTIKNDTSPSSIVLSLDFVTKEKLHQLTNCSFAKLIDCDYYIVSLITPVQKKSYHPIESDNDMDKQLKTRKADALLIQKLYDYILANLEEPLPSLKLLSKKFGTNEYKLKDGFRHFFKTSIYKFYNEERLKRAHFMIEETIIPLKNISTMNGFNNYPNFSKSFKKRFGYSPNELPRKSAHVFSLKKINVFYPF
ncbi:MAG TPA: AraC family transcriptional regulator [Flavobacterium sp.]|nr:AraC family transcriptional regulator [Flavobacterium sp.]